MNSSFLATIDFPNQRKNVVFLVITKRLKVQLSEGSGQKWWMHTDNFNAYLALSNFSNFTTNRWCTPNTRFFMVIFSKLGRKKRVIGVFQNWKVKKRVIGVRVIGVSVPIIPMKKRVFGVHHLFVVKLEKLDNAKYALKLSVHSLFSETRRHRLWTVCSGQEWWMHSLLSETRGRHLWLIAQPCRGRFAFFFFF